jgi:hypothetical protein
VPMGVCHRHGILVCEFYGQLDTCGRSVEGSLNSFSVGFSMIT